MKDYDICLTYTDFEKYIQTLRSQCNIFSTDAEREAYDYAMQSVLKFFEGDKFDTNEWIPCSEDMPPQDVLVYITYNSGDVAIRKLCYNIWCDEFEEYYDGINKIIAWMPISWPKPYDDITDKDRNND